jgi:AAA family ATP:ADP antiporter
MKRFDVRRLVVRILRPVTRVEPEEIGIVLLMTLSAFLLLSAYYLLKTVREPLILLQGGAETKLYARAGQAVLMVGFVYFYGEVARRVGRMKLLLIVFMFFIANLVVFALLARTQVNIGLAFFVWVGLFSYTIVAQFWALAADIYTEEQGKRLFPVIGAGSSIGAVLGARFARAVLPHGPQALMGTAAFILVVCVALIAWIERQALTRADTHARQEAHPDEPLASEGAFQLLARDRYLLLIAAMVVLLNWVNSSGEYLLDRTLLMAASQATAGGLPRQLFIGRFKADYYFWYNLIGVVLQLLAVSRVLKHVGVRRALFILPAFALVGYGAAALLPTLAVMRLVKIGENGMQYSVQDTTRHALFLVTSRFEKYVGKTAVDTIAVRIGAIMSALFVWMGARLGWSVTLFACINVLLACLWLLAVVALGREHRLRAGASDQEQESARPAAGTKSLRPAAGPAQGSRAPEASSQGMALSSVERMGQARRLLQGFSSFMTRN